MYYNSSKNKIITLIVVVVIVNILTVCGQDRDVTNFYILEVLYKAIDIMELPRSAFRVMISMTANEDYPTSKLMKMCVFVLFVKYQIFTCYGVPSRKCDV